MKKFGMILLIGSLICFLSCEKDHVVETTDLKILVEFPGAYAEKFAGGATVEITNLETRSAKTLITDTSGVALFTGLLPGTYNIIVSLTLTAEQALELTGFSQVIILSGSLNNLMVFGREPMQETIRMTAGRVGGLVIKEIYYTGSRTPLGGAYFLDQFHEIYNNSTDTIFADGLILALCHPAAATSSIAGWSDDPNHVYLSSAWRVPGSGRDHPIAPGASIIVSENGTNHREDPNGNPNTPYPGSIADFEAFVFRDDARDIDIPGVPNMEMLHHVVGFFFLASVFGPAVVIARVDDVDFTSLPRMTVPGSASPTLYVQLPVRYIIDGVEAGRDDRSTAFKRLPTSVDAGMIWATGTYTSQSIRRKTERFVGNRRILQDRNNTTLDFEVITPPTPRSFN